ncbi:MAG: Uma2 family endonuclease [Acetobacteraceae bacterium]|nr:Uma2 family endonuclease [Acetobacteraceae bacterium]
MVALVKHSEPISVEEFLAWNPPDGRFWQLVDGIPQAMAPAGVNHGAIQAELARLLANHLAEHNSWCAVITAPGITPHVRSRDNVRIPDLAVTCSPRFPEQALLHEPVLIVEILSPSNRTETWSNVWTYTTIPSVKEIIVVSAIAPEAETLRRLPDGSWPDEPILVREGEVAFASIGLMIPLSAIYRTASFGSR